MVFHGELAATFTNTVLENFACIFPVLITFNGEADISVR